MATAMAYDPLALAMLRMAAPQQQVIGPKMLSAAMQPQPLYSPWAALAKALAGGVAGFVSAQEEESEQRRLANAISRAREMQREEQRRQFEEFRSLFPPSPAPALAPPPTAAPQPSAAPLAAPSSPATLPSASVPPDIMGTIETVARETGVPAPLLAAVAAVESNFNPAAIGRAGEIGVMQVMPSTAQQPGFGMQGVNPETLRDPAANIRFGAQYLAARARELFPGGIDWNNPEQVRQVLQAYNGGAIRNGQTADYADRVLNRMALFAPSMTMPREAAAPAATPPAAQAPPLPAATSVRPQPTSPLLDPNPNVDAQLALLAAQGNPFAQQLLQVRRQQIDAQQRAADRDVQTQLRLLEIMKPNELERLLDEAGLPRGSNERAEIARAIAERRGLPPQTTVNLPPQESALIKVDAETAKMMNQAAVEANRLIAMFDRAEQAVRQLPDGYQASALPTIGRIMATLGYDVPEKASEAEVLRSITNTLATLQRVPGAGHTSDFDMRLYLQAVPRLGNSREGNLRLIEMGRKLAQRRIEEAKIWRRHLGEPDIFEKLEELGPVFSREEREFLQNAAGQANEPPPAPSAAPGITTPSGIRITPVR